jgi:hypothetical protein
MNARRAAYIALKVLSLYLGIRAVETIAPTFALKYRSLDLYGWVTIGASAVPLIGAVVLWLTAERLATSLGDVEPMTLREIDSILAQEDSETDDWEEEDEPSMPTANVWQPLVPAALVVLGAFFVVRSIEFAVYHASQLALHKQASFGCSGRLFQNLPPGSCRFWDPESFQSTISLGAEMVTLALGAWLVARPAAFLGTVERTWSRIRRRSETEEAGHDDPDRV